jgi:DNA-binding NarL/FixJ family response regulator
MDNITIGIVDDHKIVRDGLKELLKKIGPYAVTHEFENGNELLAAMPVHNSPSLWIVDYSMPGINGVELIKALDEAGADYKTLLLTQYFEENIINAAYHHGARGFLHKNCTALDLKFAIENIASTGYNNVVEILKRLRKYDPQESRQKKEAITLTLRERDFLELVCNEKEYTYEQMADIMSVSLKSVESYRTALFEKYDIKSKVGLVLFSYRHRLTEPFL